MFWDTGLKIHKVIWYRMAYFVSLENPGHIVSKIASDIWYIDSSYVNNNLKGCLNSYSYFLLILLIIYLRQTLSEIRKITLC